MTLWLKPHYHFVENAYNRNLGIANDELYLKD